MKKNAPVSESTQEQLDFNKRANKQDAILAVLRTRSLNRFQAEQYGDHCLHSTVSTLRSIGHIIADRWETVPTRWGKTCRVKRYWLIRTAR